MSLASYRLLEYAPDVRLVLASCSRVCAHEVDMRDISSAGCFEVWNDNAVDTTLPEYSMDFEQKRSGTITIEVLKKVRVIDCVNGVGWKRYPGRQVVHDNVRR